MTSSAPSPAIPGYPRRFATTRWSLILQARLGDGAPARAALEELCELYWLPVYGFMRRQTKDLHDAQDWTQEFFTRLLTRNIFADLNPERGRFRSFLLAAARHFCCNERDRRDAVCRGGHVRLHSLNYEDGERQLAAELSRSTSAETLFERQWALSILDRVLNDLRQEHAQADRSQIFEALVGHLSGHATDESLTCVAQHLHMNSEAVRVALHRLRKRYRHLLRREIGQTTSSAEDIEDEIRHLFLTLSRAPDR